MTGDGRSALQRLLALVAGVYLCSLVISLLFTEPADYQRSCCDPAGQKLTKTLREPEVIAQRTLEELGDDDLDLGNHRVPRGVRHLGKSPLRRKSPKSELINVQNVTRTIPQNASKARLPEYHVVLHPEYLCRQVDDDTEDPPGGGTTRTAPVFLLIIVHSHPGHKRRRNAIRETWGRVVRDYDRPRQVALAFALGLPRDYDEYKSVQNEARLYRDVIVWDFDDNYQNLTLKSLAGFLWAADHCPNATYVMKADDDVYINVPYLTDVLATYPTSSLILGSLNSQSPVRRYGQWKVDPSAYPADTFPPYCSGCAYVISVDMARRLYHVTETSQSPAVIPVEDVYVTGVLAERLGVRCQHHEQFPTWISVPSVGLVQRFLQGKLLGLHGVDWIRMHSMWHMIRECSDCATNVQQAKRWLSWVMDRDPMYR